MQNNGQNCVMAPTPTNSDEIWNRDYATDLKEAIDLLDEFNKKINNLNPYVKTAIRNIIGTWPY